jgi:biopolymer transport protein ExbB/TolQ
MHDNRWSLIFRFIILNVFGFGLVGLGLMTGWVQTIFLADKTVLTTTIIGVFVILLFLMGQRLFYISNQLNMTHKNAKKDNAVWHQHRKRVERCRANARQDINQALYIKLVGRLGGLAWGAGLLTLLGLIGTVIGIQMAVSGVDPAAAGDVSKVSQIVGTMMSGIGVALGTTLTGGILNIWAYLNYLLLAGGATRLYTKILETNSDV